MEWMDQDSLRSCAVVCRAWNEASVRVLYRDIAIANRAAFESLADFALKDARAVERLAQTTSLRVGGGQWDVPVHAVPLVFGRSMPRLQRLIFYSCLHPSMHLSFFHVLPAFRSVATLELFRFKLRCFSELRQIICAFPRLKSLKVGVGTAEQNTSSVLRPHTRIRLEQLVLGWGLAPSLAIPLISWLANSSACVRLTHLAIGRSPFNISSQVNELLAVAGQNIRFIHEMDTDTDGMYKRSSSMVSRTDSSSPDDLEFLWSTAIDPGCNKALLGPIRAPLLRDSFGKHCTFAHSPLLQAVRFELRPCTLDHAQKNKWLAITLELESILRTIRSPNIRYIKIHQSLQLTGKFSPLSTSPRLFYAGVPRERLNPGLHRILRDPVFGKLSSVEFSFEVTYVAWEFLAAQRMVSTAAHRFSEGIPHLFAPWHERGLVTVTQRFNPIYSRG